MISHFSESLMILGVEVSHYLLPLTAHAGVEAHHQSQQPLLSHPGMPETIQQPQQQQQSDVKPVKTEYPPPPPPSLSQQTTTPSSPKIGSLVVKGVLNGVTVAISDVGT